MSARPKVYEWGAAGIMLSFLVVELLFRPGFGALQIAVSGGILMSLGVPHGAFDRTLAEGLGVYKGFLGFHLIYLALVLTVFAFWCVWPTPAFILFLVGSVIHFGLGDIRPAAVPPKLRYLLAVGRGSLVVGVPLLGHGSEVAPILDAAGIHLPRALDLGTAPFKLVAALLVGSQLFLLLRARPYLGTANLLHETGQTLLLGTALWMLPPVLGFSLYFGLWHAVGHWWSLEAWEGGGRGPRRRRLRLAAPYAAIAILGLLLAGAALVALRPAEITVADLCGLAIVFVAGLTLPHALLVAWADISPKAVSPSGGVSRRSSFPQNRGNDYHPASSRGTIRG